MAEPFEVPAEAVRAARVRWAAMWGAGEIDRAGEQMIDDVLAAAAPLIAAQALRSTAGMLSAQIGTSWGLGDAVIWLQRRADELERGTDQ